MTTSLGSRALRLMAAVLFVSSAAAADGSRGLIVDFSATWCGPCQRMAPVVEKLAREGVPIKKVDVDQRGDLKLKYRIERLPTVILFVDGKEVSRHIGAMPESELRSLAAQIPAPRPPATDEPDGPIIASQRSASDEEPKRRGLLDLWPGRRDRPTQTVSIEENTVVRGNNSESSPKTIQSGPMGASVRIRVKTAREQKFGSGTVIHSSAGRTLIVSCYHLFRGATRDDKIEVDAFFTGPPQTYVGRVLRLDEEADVSLVEVSTDEAWPSVRVAPTSRAPEVRDNVVSIGCGNGEHPSLQSLLVTDIDRYDGPNNVSCTGLPVVGRSGGGLFNAKGELIGVCGAADDQPGEENDRGFYAGLFAVHDLLDAAELASLYRDSVGAIAATVPVNTPPAAATVAVATEQPRTSEVTPPRTQTAMTEATGNETDDLEFVVIIRSKSKPNLPSQVVIVDDPNVKPELLRLYRETSQAK